MIYTLKQQEDKMINVSFIGKKSVDADKPYAVFTGFMFGGPATFKVLKKYKNDDAAEYSRWFIVALTPATHGLGDMGDTYVNAVVPLLSLAEVDGRAPTKEEFAEVGKLRSALMSDGTSEVYTMEEIQAGAQPS